jgi:hypothetical protein
MLCRIVGSVFCGGGAWAQNVRYLTDTPGFWESQHYLGEHGAGARAAEAQAITANLKRIHAVLMATAR